MKKVLMIAHVFPPYGTVGGSVRLVKYLKYLTQSNSQWQPTVVTLRDDLDLLLVGRNSAFSLEDVPPNTDILRTSTSEFSLPMRIPQWLRLILRKLLLLIAKPLDRFFLIPDDNKLWTRHMLSAVRNRLKEEEYQVIYATAPPFSVLLAAAELKRETGLPLVYDIKDDWMAPDRHQGIRRYRWYFESRMEKKCIALADRIITVTEKSQEAYKKLYPEIADKVEYIPNGCDVDEYRPLWGEKPEKFEKFTLVHTGVFSSRRDMSSLFRALRRLADKNSDFANKLEFLIIGRIPSDQAKAIESNGVTDFIRNEGYLSRSDYLSVLTKCHLPVVVNYDIPTLIPGKLYEYWGSRNRMLLLDTPNSAASELVRTYDIGEIAVPDDEEAIMAVIEKAWKGYLSGDVEQLNTDGLEKFDRKYLTSKLTDVLDAAVEDVRKVKMT